MIGKGWLTQNLIPRTWTAMVFKKNSNYDYKINPQYGPMADGLWLIDLISQQNVYCFDKIGGILFTHKNSTSKKINIIQKNQIEGFNNFKKNFNRKNLFSNNEKNLIYQNLKPNVIQIISKQFFSCLLINDKNGIKKIISFLKENHFNNLLFKYQFLYYFFNFLFFLMPILRILNFLRKKYLNIIYLRKRKNFKFILKDLL